jgi:hypothetical protein
MAPTAPAKMTTPEQARKMQACEKQAVLHNIKMNERS